MLTSVAGSALFSKVLVGHSLRRNPCAQVGGLRKNLDSVAAASFCMRRVMTRSTKGPTIPSVIVFTSIRWLSEVIKQVIRRKIQASFEAKVTSEAVTVGRH